jgi:hypothetical protein
VRERDPLSSYLFILAFNLLVIWMQKLMHVDASVFPISNAHNLLLYADDSTFFFKLAIRQFEIFK